jgi:hypothetical protein
MIGQRFLIGTNPLTNALMDQGTKPAAIQWLCLLCNGLAKGLTLLTKCFWNKKK